MSVLVVQVSSAEHSVVMVFVIFSYVEIDASVTFIGIAGGENPLYGLYLLYDVSARTWLYARRSYVKLTHGLVIAKGIGLH